MPTARIYMAEWEVNNPPPLPSTTRLGLHVTTDELSIWRTRAASGPYKTAGDAQANSPGDWARIVTNKNNFVANPPRYQWAGFGDPDSGCIDGANQAGYNLPGNRDAAGSSESVRDAAFFAMVLGSEQVSGATLPAATRDSILGQVRTVLLNQARNPDIDYSNTQRFCVPPPSGNWQPYYQSAPWFSRTLLAYDYSQIANPDLWTSTQKTTFLTWANSAHRWYSAFIDLKRAGNFQGDGVTPNSESIGLPVIWHGGGNAFKVNQALDNHAPVVVMPSVLGGLLAKLEAERSGVSTLTSSQIANRLAYGTTMARDYLVCEFIAGAAGTSGGFGSGPRSGGANMYRWGDPPPINGYIYAMRHLGRSVAVADHLARAGDTSVYALSTTNGTSLSSGSVPAVAGRGWSSGPKTWREAVRRLFEFVDEASTPRRFGHNTDSSVAARIDSRVLNGEGGYTSRYEVPEWYALLANVYLQDPFVTQVYRRQLAGTPAYPAASSINHGSWWAWNGPAGLYPGVCFQFAQVEGQVWPYTGTGPAV